MNVPFPSLQLGIVVACYPEGNAIDVLLPDSGSRLTNVQVLVPGGGSDHGGTVDLPDPGIPQDDNRWNIQNNPSTNIIAAIMSYKGNPVCIGFLLPQVGQMTFKQMNRRIVRHASDVYSTTDKFGNTEWYHPSGTYLRVGTSAAHEDLTGQDFDQQWKIGNNTTTAPYFHLTLANAGVVKATVEIAPTGNISLTTVGTLTGNVTGNVDLTAPQFTLHGNVTVTGTLASGALTVNGNATINGNEAVTGTISSGGTTLTVP